MTGARGGVAAGLALAAALAAAVPAACGQAVAADDVPAVEMPGPPNAAALARREAYRALLRREAGLHGLPFEIADAVMRVESGYNAGARGAAGEVGLMQVMPPTARLLGFQGDDAALADPATNIRLGVRYLAGAWRLAKADICTAAMKYRAGHNETRFSVLSVRYCVEVRRHMAALGFPVTGSVPAPTFGFRTDRYRMGVAIGSVAATRRLYSGRKLASRVRWGAYDARMGALQAKAKAIGLGF